MSEPTDIEPEADEPEAPQDLEPAFDVDLPPEEQGTAEAASEQSG